MTGLPGRILWLLVAVLAGWLLFSPAGRRILDSWAARWARRELNDG